MPLDASTTTDRFTCHVYPIAMYPLVVVERPISVLFEDEVGPDGNVAALNLNVPEARALVAALQRAIAAREITTVGQYCRAIGGGQ